MGRSVELFRYNYDKLVDCFLEKKEIDNKEILEQILLSFGEKVGDFYILLNNEFYGEYNSYYNLTRLIDNVFNCENSFDIISYNKEADCIEMVCNRDIYSVADELKEILIGKYSYKQENKE